MTKKTYETLMAKLYEVPGVKEYMESPAVVEERERLLARKKQYLAEKEKHDQVEERGTNNEHNGRAD